MTATPTQSPPTATREPPPHRNWLLLGVAVGLLIVVAGGVGWWIGSPSDNTNAASEMPEVLEEFYDALIEGNATAIAALFTQDGRFTASMEGPTRSDSSPAMIGGLMRTWFRYVDYTEVEHLDVISEGDTVVVVSRREGMLATHQRTSKTSFSATVADVFELRDGLIARCDAYFDYNDVVA